MKIAWLFLAAALLGQSAIAEDTRCGGAGDAFLRGEFADAEKIAMKNARGTFKEVCLRMAGDASLMQGKDNYYLHYAQARAMDLDTSLYITKGDSPFWKVLSAATVVLGAAADYSNASTGVSSNNTAVAFDTATRMNASLSTTTGTKDYRATVKTVMKDLRQIGKGKAGAYPVVYPWSQMVAGIGMARIHVGSSICTGFRAGDSVFVTTTDCYNSAASVPGAFVTVGSALSEWEAADILQTQQFNGWTIIYISSNEEMARVWNRDPPRVAHESYVLSESDSLAVTWFSDDFSKVVTFFKPCKLPKLADCAEEVRSGALVWVKSNDISGWYLYGAGTSNGEVLRRH